MTHNLASPMPLWPTSVTRGLQATNPCATKRMLV
jgi:hypothetical protein